MDTETLIKLLTLIFLVVFGFIVSMLRQGKGGQPEPERTPPAYKDATEMCQSCEEKIATHHYGDIYHFCDDCNDEFLYEVAKNYGMVDGDNIPQDSQLMD